MQRLIVGNNVLDLKTKRSDFTTERDLTYLTGETKDLLKAVDPNIMDEFYNKYSMDYTMWNYSKPEDWWYPYPGLIKNMRQPNPNMLNNDFPKVKNLKMDGVSTDPSNKLPSKMFKRQTNKSKHVEFSFIVHVLVILRIIVE